VCNQSLLMLCLPIKFIMLLVFVCFSFFTMWIVSKQLLYSYLSSTTPNCVYIDEGQLETGIWANDKKEFIPKLHIGCQKVHASTQNSKKSKLDVWWCVELLVIHMEFCNLSCKVLTSPTKLGIWNRWHFTQRRFHY